MNERPIPKAAVEDPNAVEMLRVWIAAKKLHCSIKVGMYLETTKIAEEKAWGTILADAARHVARALAEGYSLDERNSLELIEKAFVAELRSPTSLAEGRFIKTTH